MNSFEKLIRVVTIEKGAGVASIGMLADSEHLNGGGAIHGGLIASLLDAACGYAGLSVVPERYSIVAAQFSTSFVRTVRMGELMATARVVRSGIDSLHIVSELTDMNGVILAQGQGVWLVQRGLVRVGE